MSAVYSQHAHARADRIAGPFDELAGNTRAGASIFTALDRFRDANPWRASGRCVTDPPPGASWWADDVVAAALAVHTCTACPVWRECLSHALTTPERFGIWGATVAGNRSTGRKGMRARLAAGVPLSVILDEHEQRLDPGDGDDLAPAVVLALRASRGHPREHTRALLLALGREAPPVPVKVNARTRRREAARARVAARYADHVDAVAS